MRLESSLVIANVDKNTTIDVGMAATRDGARVLVGNGVIGISMVMDWADLERLASAIRIAQQEHDIKTGRFVPDDGEGLVIGGQPHKVAVID